MSNQFIPGDVAFLKVSGEAVGILEYHSGANLYDVRRRVSSKRKGAFYFKEMYFAFELESEADRNLKRLQEMEDLAKAMKGAGVHVLDDRPKGPTGPPSFDNKPN